VANGGGGILPAAADASRTAARHGAQRRALSTRCAALAINAYTTPSCTGTSATTRGGAGGRFRRATSRTCLPREAPRSNSNFQAADAPVGGGEPPANGRGRMGGLGGWAWVHGRRGGRKKKGMRSLSQASHWYMYFIRELPAAFYHRPGACLFPRLGQLNGGWTWAEYVC